MIRCIFKWLYVNYNWGTGKEEGEEEEGEEGEEEEEPLPNDDWLAPVKTTF